MDREKVIYSIERCISHVPDACRDCSYDAGHPYNECVEMMLKDVLALLKEQEDLGTELTNAVELIHKKNERIDQLLKEQEAVEPEVYYIGQDKYKFYRCPVCKTNWYYKGNYCLGCGRSVKWE